jgi:hypothetical protein
MTKPQPEIEDDFEDEWEPKHDYDMSDETLRALKSKGRQQYGR